MTDTGGVVADGTAAFGLFLRDRLKRTGVTVPDFAAAVGISRSTAYRMHAGAAAEKLDPDVALRLARYLDLSVEDLLDLYGGREASADIVIDEREAVIRRFMRQHAELTPEQLRDVLQVAGAAAKAMKRRESD